MAKQPQNIQEELTQIVDEFRVMHARVNGQTHAQAARTEAPEYSKSMQYDALTRWNCQNLDEYRPLHPRALRATMFQIRETAAKIDLNTLWGGQLIATHEYLRLMREQALHPPTPSEHRTGEPKKSLERNQGHAGSSRSREEPAQTVYVPPPALRRVWAHVDGPAAFRS